MTLLRSKCLLSVLILLWLSPALGKKKTVGEFVKDVEKNLQKFCPFDSEYDINFVSKSGENKIWPYEYTYIKASFSPKLPYCGSFRMRPVDLPLRALQFDHNTQEWQLAGKSQLAGKPLQKTSDAGSLNNIDQSDAEDVPHHLLYVKPVWYKRGKIIWYIRQRKAQLYCNRKWRKTRYTVPYLRCKQWRLEQLMIGPKELASRYPMRWKRSKIFSRKSRTYRLKIKNKYVEKIHPGIEGAGAVNKLSEAYQAYPSFNYLLKYLEANSPQQQMSATKDIGDEDEAVAEARNNLKVNFFFILHYSHFNTKGCVINADCIKKGQTNYPFFHEFFNIISIPPSERLGVVNLEFKPKTVFALSGTDGTVPNVINNDHNLPGMQHIKARLRLKRGCGFGGKCTSRFRSVFGKDGWDLFPGEQVVFRLVILNNEKHFTVRIFQNPFLRMFYGPGQAVFGAGQRRKTIRIIPNSKLEFDTYYEFSYELDVKGNWHKFFLYEQKLFESEKREKADAIQQQLKQKDSDGCQRTSVYAPRRPQLGCSWPPLKRRYTQRWWVQPLKPGYFEHDTLDVFLFHSMGIGSKQCGRITAKLEKYPVDSMKNYIKLLLQYSGTNGGLEFENDDHRVLRFPSKLDLSLTVQRKYMQRWCVTAKMPGTYMMSFRPYGSLLNLFPTQPNPMQINVAQPKKFHIKITSSFDGATLYNNQWSGKYYIEISRMPDKGEHESEIVVTPQMDDMQFSPTQFIWSSDTSVLRRTTRKYFRVRPMLECAFGGQNIHVKWNVNGMVSRVHPYPLPSTPLRVTEAVGSTGCDNINEAVEPESEEVFEALSTEEQQVVDSLQNKDNVVQTNNTGAIHKDRNSKKKEEHGGMTLTVALMLLSIFALAILMLCVFGCLGNDEQFEMLVASQLQTAMANRYQQLVIEKMNAAATSNVVRSHYAKNIDARKRLMEQNELVN